MNTKNTISQLFCCLLLVSLCLFCSSAWAVLSFNPEKDGNPEKIELVIDKVEKLAGMKITINYDREVLSFVKAEKSKATSSFLHVVNDKTPGKLIIVMASATGISGKNIPLIHMTFSRQETDGQSSSRIFVSQVQLMDENLKEIAADKPQFIFQIEKNEQH